MRCKRQSRSLQIADVRHVGLRHLPSHCAGRHHWTTPVHQASPGRGPGSFSSSLRQREVHSPARPTSLPERSLPAAGALKELSKSFQQVPEPCDADVRLGLLAIQSGPELCNKSICQGAIYIELHYIFNSVRLHFNGFVACRFGGHGYTSSMASCY